MRDQPEADVCAPSGGCEKEDVPDDIEEIVINGKLSDHLLSLTYSTGMAYGVRDGSSGACIVITRIRRDEPVDKAALSEFLKALRSGGYHFSTKCFGASTAHPSQILQAAEAVYVPTINIDPALLEYLHQQWKKCVLKCQSLDGANRALEALKERMKPDQHRSWVAYEDVIIQRSMSADTRRLIAAIACVVDLFVDEVAIDGMRVRVDPTKGSTERRQSLSLPQSQSKGSP